MSIILIFGAIPIFAQRNKTDANIIGHVVADGSHLSFVSVVVKGTTIGTVTDETGHYRLINVPAGELTLVAASVGYKQQEMKVKTFEGETNEVNFELVEDVLKLDEVVVSANRNEQKRTEAPVIVNTISPGTFQTSQSLTLGEGLNFTPGLRLENNCQNCGFTQVRMNGMEGPYSQILINSRPIFSGLAGVYGLELIPSSMIEKVEVVRGGGSALYGSNAIAGTINIILKTPVRNTYEFAANYALTGLGVEGSNGPVPDYTLNFNTSLVSDDSKSGIAIYGFTRDRKMFDANGDDYSEISPMNNLTAGTRIFHRFGHRDKLSLDFFTIKEERDGGNKQDYPLHERNVAEAVKHNLKSGALTFEKYFRDYDLLSAYASGQYLNRDSYYGANYSLSDYGNSVDKTYNVGVQYKAVIEKSSLVVGLENTGGFLTDKKLGYPDYGALIASGDTTSEVTHRGNTTVADQRSVTTGAFAQYDIDWNKFKFALGGRFDRYEITDLESEDDNEKSGNVFSPRINIMYEILDVLKARISYSQGYRAPQVFDEDLHIETSGSRQVINVNDPDLKQETSHSYMASLDFNGLIGTMYSGILAEAFYTRLEDPFVNDIGSPDSEGTVIYTRKNAEDGAVVKGVNLEVKLKPLRSFYLSSGFTVQSSLYDEPQEFDEKCFPRTPEQYGFLALDWDFTKNFCLSASGTYTGSMQVPYFGPETDPDEGELRTSDSFYDIGLKIKYTHKINGASLQWFAGIKNILNSYQSDFDKGSDRDPAYIYGPVSPRTIYFGIRFGNILN